MLIVMPDKDLRDVDIFESLTMGESADEVGKRYRMSNSSASSIMRLVLRRMADEKVIDHSLYMVTSKGKTAWKIRKQRDFWLGRAAVLREALDMPSREAQRGEPEEAKEAKKPDAFLTMLDIMNSCITGGALPARGCDFHRRLVNLMREHGREPTSAP